MQRRYCGRLDPPLNGPGRDEVLRLRLQLRSQGLLSRTTPIIASPLRRAAESAQLLAGGESLLPIDGDPRWREIDFGEWEGKTYAEATANAPAPFNPERIADPSFTFPGGESLLQVYARVGAALPDLLSLSEAGVVVVVAHLGSIAAALLHLRGQSLEKFWETKLPLAGHVIVDLAEVAA